MRNRADGISAGGQAANSLVIPLRETLRTRSAPPTEFEPGSEAQGRTWLTATRGAGGQAEAVSGYDDFYNKRKWLRRISRCAADIQRQGTTTTTTERRPSNSLGRPLRGTLRTRLAPPT